ncbi:ABC transporter transmembrane region-domain-containing protein [Ochromonadaceae sp. CCMP2298]|nr:ABC transporter transmembrane region-domain-containing protein [Ochromonadaceae sp. CCMP2298]
MSAWVSMLVVAAILIELVFILNVASAFAGVACMVLLIPLMVYFAKRFAQYRGQTAAATDSRVRYISELIDGIITVKSFAWETPFFQMICSLREEESSYIAKSQLLRAVNQGLMFCTAAVVAFATFGVYWGTGGRLTIPQVFATISLLQVLRFSIGRAWTRSIETGSEAIASCLRIETFLALQPRVECAGAGAGAEAGAGAGAGALVSKSVPLFSLLPASFHYGTDSSNLVLQNISLSLSPGELVMVVGPVGAGKSSLLSAVLGELSSVGSQGPQGQQEVQGQGVQKRFLRAGTRVAYCAQRPWILASSVRSNVVLAGREEGDVGGLGETELDLEQRQGQSEQQRQQQQEMQQEMQQLRFDFKQARTLDLPLYTTAVESCLLVDDMSKWPAYDDTEVGNSYINPHSHHI